MMQNNHNLSLQKTENPILVYNRKSLAAMIQHLSQQPRFALDTESNSLYCYYPKVCLIQLTTYADAANLDEDAVVDYLVDPVRLPEIEALGLLLANPAIQKVLHAAENDMLTLQRDFGFVFHNIFDTQLAARILGWKRLGLAAILEENFGIVSDKRMQRTDWGKRPLTPDQIAYAQMDTHYLLTLRSRQIAELQKRGRWEEAQEAFIRLNQNAQQERPEEPRTVWSMKGVRDVPKDALGRLDALWQWRENEAQRLNRPPFKVVNDEVLFALAQDKPGQIDDLRLIRGLSPHQINTYGLALLNAVRSGEQRQPPPPPTPTPRPESLLDRAATARFEALRKWRSAVAEARDVTPDIVFTNETLLAIAQCNPRSETDLGAIPDIGPWKLKTYGAEILQLLRS